MTQLVRVNDIDYIDVPPEQRCCGSCLQWDGIRKMMKGNYRVIGDKFGNCRAPANAPTMRTMGLNSCKFWKPVDGH